VASVPARVGIRHLSSALEDCEFSSGRPIPGECENRDRDASAASPRALRKSSLVAALGVPSELSVAFQRRGSL